MAVLLAGGVFKERIKTDGRVEAAAGVAKERASADRCVIDPVESVAGERTRTHGGIVTTICVVLEGTGTVGRVIAAGCVLVKCLSPDRGVSVGSGIGKECSFANRRVGATGCV